MGEGLNYGRLNYGMGLNYGGLNYGVGLNSDVFSCFRVFDLY